MVTELRYAERSTFVGCWEVLREISVGNGCV
jgi:hypothetical protein